MELGELPADRGRAIAQNRSQGAQGLAQPVRRLVQHQRLRPGGQALELAPAVAPLPRQEADKGERRRRQAARDEGRERGARPRHNFDAAPQHANLGDKLHARIGDRRHAGIRHEGYGAGGETAEHARRGRGFVLLAVADQRRVDTAVREERTGPPRVLGGHQRHLAQDPYRPQTDIFEVADGRAHDVERAQRRF